MKTGIDIIETKRIKPLLKDINKMKNIFDEQEIQYIFAKGVNALQTASGIFCVKEAVIKALDFSIVKRNVLKGIIVLHSNSGAPYIYVNEIVKSGLEKIGAKEIELSIAHTKNTAVAICVAK